MPPDRRTPPPPDALTEAERRALRARATERLEALAAEAATASGLHEDITLDQQSVGRLSRIDALQRRAMAEATSARRTRETARLRQALRALDDPEYGFCAECGERIPFARLDLDPALTRCAACMRG